MKLTHGPPRWVQVAERWGDQVGGAILQCWCCPVSAQPACKASYFSLHLNLGSISIGASQGDVLLHERMQALAD